MTRVGLFGGTFNPIHSGHIRAAEKVRDAFDLDTLFFIPSALPPHKSRENLADAKDRLDMIRLATRGGAGFSVSDAEIQRPGASYTIDTARHFKKKMGPFSDVFLVVGMDAFLEIHTWKSYKKLFSLTAFIVMTRLDGGVGKYLDSLGAYIRSRVSGGYGLSQGESCFRHSVLKPVFFFDVKPLDISSTRIRSLIRSGESPGPMLPASVMKFISQKGFYR
ncbi:putative nicotinate-nucleotide adenylyltransferase [Candidatus Desulfarcum epimagneticum]|uniref:Probable nicotinate-nucleotide adenylyltransferase n=1 Tax=uncultured Desulfobacteraceae bacterium TaxID=218296 RepID=A0A484HF66_9BACT|nr:putative nicotinate-nucleotide adenylyltransferase [uncultured Desulfobacteraceae bacterium]